MSAIVNMVRSPLFGGETISTSISTEKKTGKSEKNEDEQT